YDVSPFRANANLSFAGPPTWDAGLGGLGLRFNGTTDYQDVGNLPHLGANLLGPLTLLAVVIPDDGTRGDIVTKWGVAGQRQYDLLQGVNAGKFAFFLTSSAASLKTSGPSTISIVAGQRYAVAGKYDGTFISVHVDGIRENDTNIGSLTLQEGTTTSTRIGSDSNTPLNAFAGIIEQAIISNRPWSDSEIYKWAQDPFGPFRMEDIAPWATVAAPGVSQAFRYPYHKSLRAALAG
ncbi:hypothetical protein LCGC14_1880840, partial [marine sediment metagenome]